MTPTVLLPDPGIPISTIFDLSGTGLFILEPAQETVLKHDVDYEAGTFLPHPWCQCIGSRVSETSCNSFSIML